MTRLRGWLLSAPLLIAGVAVAFWQFGSWSYPKNPELPKVDPNSGYRFGLVAKPDPAEDETFIVLSFSGGGTRAAALSYGVLEYLRDSKIAGGAKSLVDEVDIISSVSGGSFAAAYYGRFGKDRFFAEFPDAVLHRKIQTDIILRILAPWNWPRLLSKDFGRSDLADEYYHKNIFGESTYADMPRNRPFIILNSTDMSLGSQFSFVQEHFDRLCSNLDAVHLSRGVTASSAFPGAFTPLTLKNYHPPEPCGERLPRWVATGLSEHEQFPREYRRSANWSSYEDPERKYVHLIDGGLADNIGLRGPEWAILGTQSAWSLLSKVNDGVTKRIVVIAVDATPKVSMERDQSAAPPGVFDVLNTAATKPMENYSADTVVRVRDGFQSWNQQAGDFEKRQALTQKNCRKLAEQICEGSAECVQMRQNQCTGAFKGRQSGPVPHAALYLVQAKFDLLEDDALRERVEEIPTALQLPDKDIEDLVQAGRLLLQQSHPYQCLLHVTGGKTPEGFVAAGCPES